MICWFTHSWELTYVLDSGLATWGDIFGPLGKTRLYSTKWVCTDCQKVKTKSISRRYGKSSELAAIDIWMKTQG